MEVTGPVGSTEVGVVGAPTGVPEATVLSLPEGASMMIGEEGEQYVTIVQDGQTYAIPLTEYQTMQPGGLAQENLSPTPKPGQISPSMDLRDVSAPSDQIGSPVQFAGGKNS